MKFSTAKTGNYRRSRLAALAITILSLSGCSGLGVKHYQDQAPKLTLEGFFSGKLVAYGMVSDRGGTVSRRFKADMVGTWKDNEGILDEVFIWSDGERQTRTWKLIKNADGTYTGTAGDVVNQARAEIAGNAAKWSYVLAVPYKGKTLDVTMHDWMYLIDEQTAISTVRMTKFGFHVGNITLAIQKLP